MISWLGQRLLSNKILIIVSAAKSLTMRFVLLRLKNGQRGILQVKGTANGF